MLTYTVRWADARSHRFHVEVSLEAATELVFPSWAPGSYLMREFARNVRDIHAHHRGGPVAVHRLGRNRWAVAGPCTLEYDVYAREKSVRTPYLDEGLAFFLPSNLLVHPVGGGPSRLRVQVPAGQLAVCPLGESVAGPAFAEWTAPDVDSLHDSPVSVAAFGVRRFEVDGVPHEHYVEPGHDGDEDRMAEALARIVRAAKATVGELPYRRYQFVSLHMKEGHGGLEHKDCSVLLRPRLGYADDKGFEEWATLAAHEHFHAWNVKRIHPDSLGPRFDYDREHHSRNLWWLEGGTVYYEERIAWRAGIVSEARHLERLAELAHKLAHTPGRRHQSLEDSSFDAWIKLYRPGEDSPNSTVSYYLKGAVVCWLMDLEILRRTGGRFGLDDLLRELWARWGRQGVGFPEEGTIEALATALAGGGDFGRWYDRHVRGTDEVALAEGLAAVGLRLEAVAGEKGAALGVELSGLVVKTVFEGGPAWPALCPGDELLALDGERLGDLGARLAALPPGRSVRLLLSRDAKIREVELTLGQPRPKEFRLSTDTGATEGAISLRRRWLSLGAETRESG